VAGIGNANVTIQIVILAMIAAFLGLRLYSVLGRRAEHEEEILQGRFDDKPGIPGAQGNAQNRTSSRPAPRLPAPSIQAPNGQRRENAIEIPAVERGLREIAQADRQFDITAFVEGARGAYRMILEAFWRGDKDELSQLCDADVFDGFATAIDARAAAGETLDNRLVRIEDITIVDASFAAPLARVTVRFTADIATVTRDAKDQVIAGSLDDAVETRDVWTFSRNITVATPDWLLDETDEG
jgi:predicted lipid-binding transport protein (Tim44 family)